jgi:hypothetical protein
MKEKTTKLPAWQLPVPFAAPAGDPFPVEVLPPALAAFVEQAAAAHGCAVDLVAAPVLAVAGTMIGSSRVLQLREDRCERPALFLAVVAEHASGAAEALRLVTEPVFRAQQRSLARYEERKAQYEIERAQYRPPKPMPLIVLPGDEAL